MKKLALLTLLITLISCNGGSNNYQYFKIPEIEQCRFLSKSIFCTDSRLNNSNVDRLIQNIQSNASIPEAQKSELISYFETNRSSIIKSKEFELPLDYKGFFRGYLLIPVRDERDLKNFIDNKLRDLDRYIDLYGPLRRKKQNGQRELSR